MTIYSLDILLSQFGTSRCSMSGSNCCFLTCIQLSQDAGDICVQSSTLVGGTFISYSLWDGKNNFQVRIWANYVDHPIEQKQDTTALPLTSLTIQNMHCRPQRSQIFIVYFTTVELFTITGGGRGKQQNKIQGSQKAIQTWFFLKDTISQ